MLLSFYFAADYKFKKSRMSNDLAGVWEVALSDGVHRIEFEHGTTTGKRVIYVDGKVRIWGGGGISNPGWCG